MKEIKGDIIELAKGCKFDAIVHGCNCFCVQRAGLAKQMSEEFNTDRFIMEMKGKGDINKLGQIDYEWRRMIKFRYDDDKSVKLIPMTVSESYKGTKVAIINAYTQYEPGSNGCYASIRLAMRKINHIFKGKHIGIPQIGCGIAGLNWSLVKVVIKAELTDVDYTLITYKKSKSKIRRRKKSIN